MAVEEEQAKAGQGENVATEGVVEEPVVADLGETVWGDVAPGGETAMGG